jgi:DNA repair ATPase RecN
VSFEVDASDLNTWLVATDKKLESMRTRLSKNDISATQAESKVNLNDGQTIVERCVQDLSAAIESKSNQLNNLQALCTQAAGELAGCADEQNSIADQHVVSKCEPTEMRDEYKRLKMMYSELNARLDAACKEQNRVAHLHSLCDEQMAAAERWLSGLEAGVDEAGQNLEALQRLQQRLLTESQTMNAAKTTANELGALVPSYKDHLQHRCQHLDDR